MTKIIAVLGGQYGSEGKGVITAHLACNAGGRVACIRAGSPNAGHTVFAKGSLVKLRQVPAGFKNCNAELYIGPGAVVDPEVLASEVALLDAMGWEVKRRLFIDYRVKTVTAAHKEKERGLAGRIGSTETGTGAARADNVMRMSAARDQSALSEINKYCAGLVDVPSLLCEKLPILRHLIIEGTQGFRLSLNYGPFPYVTSNDCTLWQLLNDCGIPGSVLFGHELVVVGVFRRFPIRVAGNSGPLPGEISWDDLSRQLRRQVPERTTATGKIRRVATFDMGQCIAACKILGITMLALTFVDYDHPEAQNAGTLSELPEQTQAWIRSVEQATGIRAGLIGVGRRNEHEDFRVLTT